jgi:hypothetical protein
MTGVSSGASSEGVRQATTPVGAGRSQRRGRRPPSPVSPAPAASRDPGRRSRAESASPSAAALDRHRRARLQQPDVAFFRGRGRAAATRAWNSPRRREFEGAVVFAAGESGEGELAGAAVERRFDSVFPLGEGDLWWVVVGFQSYGLVGVASVPVDPAVTGGGGRAGQRVGSQLAEHFVVPRLRRVGGVAVADHQHAAAGQVFVIVESPKSVTAPTYRATPTESGHTSLSGPTTAIPPGWSNMTATGAVASGDCDAVAPPNCVGCSVGDRSSLQMLVWNTCGTRSGPARAALASSWR